MALTGRIVFLARIRKDYSSLSDASFLNAFSYSIYDFLENYRGFEKYASLYGNGLYEKLKDVSQETFICEKEENGHKSKDFLNECLNGQYDYFIRTKLRAFLMPFLSDCIKNINGDQDSINYLPEDF